MRKGIDEIIKTLSKEDNVTLKKGVTVANVNVGKSHTTPKGSYNDVVITLNEDIPAFVQSADGKSWTLGTNDVVFTSTIPISAILKRMPDVRFITKMAKVMPEILEEILADATIDILCEEVKEKEQYKNPFSDKVDTVKHNSVFTTPYAITLGAFGIKAVKRYRKMKAEIEAEEYKARMRKANASVVDDDDDDDED